MRVSDIIIFLQSNHLDMKVVGDTSGLIDGFSSIYNYKEGTISWVRDEQSLLKANNASYSQITCVICPTDLTEVPFALCQIKVDDPKAVFFYIVEHYWGQKNKAVISDMACIEDGAVIGKDTSVGAFTFISADARIGTNCYIGSNVTIKGRVCIGNDCVIQSGAVIGEDGFQFIEEKDTLLPVPHYGGVRIGNHVSVGSCTCVCRGTIDDTVLEDYVKVDNLCHIAHNVVLGKRVRVVAGAVIMGSVRVGEDSWVSTSMIRDQRQVGDKAVVGMGAVVVKDVANNATVAGNPAREFNRREKI